MHRSTVSILGLAACLLAANSSLHAQTSPVQQPSAPVESAKPTPVSTPDPDWVVRSNQYTQMLFDVQMKHSPEAGSAQGLAKYDTSITDASRADEIAQRKELIVAFGEHLPGDPAKLAAAVLRIAGMDDPPLRLLLGQDVLHAFREKSASWAASVDEWEDVTVSMNFD